MSIPDLSRARWRTSSHSSGNGECVEVATTPGGIIAVRDSKDPVGPNLVLGAQAWRRFAAKVRAGQLSIP